MCVCVGEIDREGERYREGNIERSCPEGNEKN